MFYFHQPLTLIVLLLVEETVTSGVVGWDKGGQGGKFGDQLLFNQTDLQSIISFCPQIYLHPLEIPHANCEFGGILQSKFCCFLAFSIADLGLRAFKLSSESVTTLP